MHEATKLPVPTLVPWTTRLTVSLRFKFFLTGVLFPLICLASIVYGAVPCFDIPWQSGQRIHHVTMLLSYPAISAFFPLLICNFISLVVWCFRPDTYRHALIRVGIYSGAIVALMFNVLLFFTVAIIPQIIAFVVAPALALVVWGLGALVRKRFSILYLVVVTSVCCVLLAVLIPWLKAKPQLMDSVYSTLLLIVGSAAPLGCFTFARASSVVFYLETDRTNQNFDPKPVSLSFITGWIVWVGGMSASWKFALEMQAAEYAKLPLTDPNCYVSSAAAYGHRRIVEAAKRNDDVFVNLQMKRLKFLEFALATSLPRTHRLVRALYNRIGPKLAKVCKANRWFADLTYVGLKPLELAAEAIRRSLGVRKEVVLKLYEPARKIV